MSKGVLDTIIDSIENGNKRSAENWNRYAAAIKRKTSGPRWRIIKKTAVILGAVGLVACFVSFWALGVVILGVSVVLGLAAKS